jgi:hypothetical protein
LAAVTIPMSASALTQNTTAVNLTVNSVIFSNSSGPTVTLGAISPTPTGEQSINDDTVTGSTNDSLGLTISLAEQSASLTGLISGGNTIATSAGTTTTPVLLAANTWGWREDSLTGTGFGAGPTSAVSSVAPSASIKFAAIPANASPYNVDISSTTGSTSANIWYGATVTTSQPTGAYTTTVVYTFTPN